MLWVCEVDSVRLCVLLFVELVKFVIVMWWNLMLLLILMKWLSCVCVFGVSVVLLNVKFVLFCSSIWCCGIGCGVGCGGGGGVGGVV